MFCYYHLTRDGWDYVKMLKDLDKYDLQPWEDLLLDLSTLGSDFTDREMWFLVSKKRYSSDSLPYLVCGVKFIKAGRGL